MAAHLSQEDATGRLSARWQAIAVVAPSALAGFGAAAAAAAAAEGEGEGAPSSGAAAAGPASAPPTGWFSRVGAYPNGHAKNPARLADLARSALAAAASSADAGAAGCAPSGLTFAPPPRVPAQRKRRRHRHRHRHLPHLERVAPPPHPAMTHPAMTPGGGPAADDSKGSNDSKPAAAASAESLARAPPFGAVSAARPGGGAGGGHAIALQTTQASAPCVGVVGVTFLLFPPSA